MLEDAREDSLLEALERGWHGQNFDFAFLVSVTTERINFFRFEPQFVVLCFKKHYKADTHLQINFA